MQTLWRPMMGWMYMLICLLDMAVFPVLWALWQGVNHVNITQWNPLTLQGAGLFHIAMGAVLGISAFGRTQEKLAGTAVNPEATLSTQNVNMTGNQSGGFGSGSTNNFNGGGFGGGTSGGSAFGGGTSGGFGSGSTNNFNGGGFGGGTSGGFGGTAPATSSGFGSTAAPAFGSASSAPTFSTTPATTVSGKPAGPTQSFPPM